jgi:hypothetical protein
MASTSRTQLLKTPIEVHILSHELRLVIAVENAKRSSPTELSGSLGHTQFETNPPPCTQVDAQQSRSDMMDDLGAATQA